MKALAEALGVMQGDVVSFVGAGGKTTSMTRLAAELAAQGRGVVVATTTHIREPFLSDVRAILLEPDPEQMLSALPSLVMRYHLVAVGPGVTGIDPSDNCRKLERLAPELVGRVAGLPGVDNVLVEADGAKGRSLKAPAVHEPVVPGSTTLLVPLAAIDVVGQPLDPVRVHRPEIVAQLTGLRASEPVTAAAVAAVLAHPLGGLKGCPSSARVVPVINKAETPALFQRALEVALRLSEDGAVERVVVGAVANRSVEFEVVGRRKAADPELCGKLRVAAVVLAAGAGRRFGGCKQLATIDGQPMVVLATGAALASSVDEVVVVLGSEAEAIAQALSPSHVRTLPNPDWQEGIASSLRCGLAAVAAHVDAVLFVLADQVRLTSAEIDSVVSAYRRAPCRSACPRIVVPVHRGRRGNPVLFDRACFAELLAISGDEGGRALLVRHHDDVLEVPVPTDGVVVDVDYPADLPPAGTAGPRG